MDHVRFEEDFPKLENPLFSTIRLKELKEDKVYEIITPTRTFKASLLLIKEVNLSTLSDKFLCEDTNTKTRGEAMAKLRTFFPDLSDNHTVNLMWFHNREALKNDR
jgi:hypothetical protein